MIYEFELHKERAEILKEAIGARCKLSTTDDSRFLRVQIEIVSAWDIMQVFHAGIDAGHKAAFAKEDS